MKNKTVLFYSSISDKSLFDTQKFYQVDIHLLQQLGYDVLLSNSILDAFLFWKYNFVFAYFYRYAFFVALIAILFGRRTFFTGGIDALDKHCVGRKKYLIQRLFFQLCYIVSKKCVIVSKADYEHVVAILGDRVSKLYYSEHTIDCGNFPSTLNENREILFSSIVWMGNIGNVKRKGIDKALLLFSLLRKYKEFQGAKFVIIGRKGEGTKFVNALIKKYGISDCVTITGEISEQEKIDILTKSRYYIQLSVYEGFGLAALEGLIAGNVVIHSGKGGLDNPIYRSHVLVDIDKDLQKQVDMIKRKLLSIDYHMLYGECMKYKKYYDNSRRLNDFKNIIA